MRKPRNVSDTGLFSSIAATINENFLLQYQQLLQYQMDAVKFCGQYANEMALKTACPSASIGCYAYVSTVVQEGSQSWQMWRWNGTKWVNSGETIPAGMVTINQEVSGGGAGSSGELQAELKVKKAVGYLSVGTTFAKGTSIEAVLRQMLYQSTPPSASVVASSSEVEVGSSLSGVSFTIYLNKNDGGALKSLSITFNGHTTTVNVNSITDRYVFTPSLADYEIKTYEEKSYTCTAVAEFDKNDQTGEKAVTLTPSASVTAYYKCYVGCLGSEPIINESVVKSYLNASNLCTGNSFSFSRTSGNDETVILIISPWDAVISNMRQSGQNVTTEAFESNEKSSSYPKKSTITVQVVEGVSKTFYYQVHATKGTLPDSMSFNITKK